MATILARINPSMKGAMLMMAATAPTTDAVQYRKNIRNLSADELAALREAFVKLYQINDDRGYQSIAGIHGLPLPIYCPHGNPLFTVWHRPYVYWLEKALQDQVAGVTIPYWDWTDQISQREGMPTAYTEPTWRNRQTGQQEPNPLLKAEIKFQGSDFSETNRDPGSLALLRQLPGQVRSAQQISTSYSRYSTALENPHNGLHGWVGGTMGIVPYSAYDPIFWAHHCNVDRLFAQWQASHPNISPVNETFRDQNGRVIEIWTAVLRPFNMTTKDIWNTRDLGYEYLTAEVSAPRLAEATTAAAPSKFNVPVANLPLSQLERDFETAELQLHNVKHPKNSFEIRVFLNQPDANANTPTEGNDHFAGSMFLFGHGECAGDVGHCDPQVHRGKFDLRPSSHVAPFTLFLDVTNSIKTMVDNTDEVTVKLVAVDFKGNQIDQPETDFDAIALVTK